MNLTSMAHSEIPVKEVKSKLLAQALDKEFPMWKEKAIYDTKRTNMTVDVMVYRSRIVL